MSRVLQSVKVLKPITVLRPTVKAISPPSSPINTNTNTTRKMSSTGAFDTAGFQVPLFGKTERQPTAEEKALVDDVLNLYQLNPIDSAYAHYAPTATFHDPIGIAHGLDLVKSQFNGMPRIFSKSITKGVKFVENPEVKPPSVQFVLSQEYTGIAPPVTKLINSLVTLHVNPSTNLIETHDEEWDAQPNTTSEDGFFGALNEMRKKATANMVRLGVDPTPKQG